MLKNKSNDVLISPFYVKIMLTVLLEGSDPGSLDQKELAITNPNMNPNVPHLYRNFYLRALTSLKVSQLLCSHHHIKNPFQLIAE
jgi:hypothetical protein